MSKNHKKKSRQPEKLRELDELDDSELTAQELYDRCLKLNPDKQLCKDLARFNHPNAVIEE